jgi:hypothetical protein
MNNWNIPEWLECEVIKRDQNCVYCRVGFRSSAEAKGLAATWEHIVNDETIVTRENIARCCSSCNASKGTKDVSDWLESEYCKNRGITKETVAEVVRRALVTRPSNRDNIA